MTKPLFPLEYFKKSQKNKNNHDLNFHPKHTKQIPKPIKIYNIRKSSHTYPSKKNRQWLKYESKNSVFLFAKFSDHFWKAEVDTELIKSNMLYEKLIYWLILASCCWQSEVGRKYIFFYDQSIWQSSEVGIKGGIEAINPRKWT